MREFDYNDEMDDDLDSDEPTYSVDDALAALPIDPHKLVPPEVVYGLSDLDPDDLERVRVVWQKLPDEQRIIIMERLVETTQADLLVDYTVFASLSYNDPVPDVRLNALEAGRDDDSYEVMQIIMNMAKRDPAVQVRAGAMMRLMDFIEMGELEEDYHDFTIQAEELALAILNDPNEPVEVRRYALEAIAQSSRTEVPPLIETAYEHDDLRMRISAVTAMGYTCDDVWEPIVLEELGNTNQEMRREAIRAAGMIAIEDAVSPLSRFVKDPNEDIQEVAIWALGEIGGDEAIEILERLALQAEEDEDWMVVEWVEDALAMAYAMMSADYELGLMDYDPEDDELLDDDDLPPYSRYH